MPIVERFRLPVRYAEIALLSCCMLLTRMVTCAEAAAPAVSADSSKAISELKAALGKEGDWSALGAAPCAKVPLTKADAATAKEQLAKAWAAQIAKERAQELRDKVIRIGDKEMRFELLSFAQKQGKRDLFISMHGGGGGPKEVNDQQWQNQIRLYQPKNSIYVAPRAPTDTWDLWHQSHIDGLFVRLIQDLVVLENVDPNRVYLIGYSAGGDGAYQLGPRMAYRLAAVGAMAGHPNETVPLGLRNIGFALYTGENDAAYKRNEIAKEWKKKLDDLAAADPKGYPHKVELAAGCGHWMNGKEKEAIPWMQTFTRNPVPDRVVWVQDDVTHESFYWLRVQGADKRQRTKLLATYAKQVVTLESSDVKNVTVLLDDRMMDLDQPLTIRVGEKTVFEGLAPRTIANYVASLQSTGDPELAFPAAVTVKLGD
jgi:hypothetical protein